MTERGASRREGGGWVCVPTKEERMTKRSGMSFIYYFFYFILIPTRV